MANELRARMRQLNRAVTGGPEVLRQVLGALLLAEVAIEESPALGEPPVLVVGKSEGLTPADEVLIECAKGLLAMQHRPSVPPSRATWADVAVQNCLQSLSFSEREAVVHVLTELGGPQGMVVASRVADREGITRSVIVNALRKLESAGVIRSKSLGMKGTFIQVEHSGLLGAVKQAHYGWEGQRTG